jgi:alpha-L-fucosidase
VVGNDELNRPDSELDAAWKSPNIASHHILTSRTATTTSKRNLKTPSLPHLKIHAGLALTLLGGALLSAAQPAAVPAARAETQEARDARMQWWREARFGMFVHWGLYSGLAGTWEGKSAGSRGGMEWIQKIVRADTATYARAAIPLFKPKPGFAKEWARLAKQAGCRYVVFTTKHHDGFSLHSSKFGDFNAGTVLQRDLVREIVEACRAEGLRVGFYHSVIDWHHPSYDYARAKGLPYPRPDATNAPPRVHAKYVDYLHAQVGELVSNYGPVDILWWDFSSKNFQGDEAWRATELANLVRSKQPRIIMNNRLYAAATVHAGAEDHGDAAEWRGDFKTPEQRIPATGLPGSDWETCMTLNTTWGYSDHDHAWKSSETLIQNLVDIASKGGNYLLNIGPKGDGSLNEPTVRAFMAMGAWMKVNGESIYGTQASPFTSLKWGRATQKGNTLYLHVFDWPKDGLLTVPITNRTAKAVLLADPGTSLPVTTTSQGVTLKLPATAPDPAVSVIRLQLAEPPELIPAADVPKAEAP